MWYISNFLQDAGGGEVTEVSACDEVVASEKDIVNDTAAVADEPDTEAEAIEEPQQPQDSGGQPTDTGGQFTDTCGQPDDSGDAIVSNADAKPVINDAEPEQPASVDVLSSEADDNTAGTDNPPIDTDESAVEPPRLKTVDDETS